MAGLAAIGGIISGVAGAIGSVVSAMGAAQAANAQADAKSAQAQEERRKGIQEAAAKQQEARQRDQEMKRVMSDQRAGFASSGGGVDIGSPYVVAQETAQRGIFNRDATIWEGAEAKAGREAQARVYELEADAYRQSAKTQMLSGVIGGVSNVFGSFKGGGGGGTTGGNYRYG